MEGRSAFKGKTYDFIKGLSLFEDLKGRDLDYALRFMKLKSFKKNAYIFFEQERQPGIFILVEGIVKLVKELEDGKNVILSFLFPKDIFGWIELKKGKWEYEPYSAITKTSVKLLHISNEDFIKLAVKYPAIAIRLSCEFTTNLFKAYESLKSIATGKVEQRLARALVELSKRIGVKEGGKVLIRAPITRQDLAEMTGTTVETTIRTISKWKREGLVRTERGLIEILNFKSLLNLSL